MLRKARLEARGALHHIIVRGIEGRKFFREDFDLRRVLEQAVDMPARLLLTPE
jgi:hypothetical protein